MGLCCGARRDWIVQAGDSMIAQAPAPLEGSIERTAGSEIFDLSALGIDVDAAKNAAASKQNDPIAPVFGTPEFAAWSASFDHRNIGYRAFKRVFDIVFALIIVAIGFIPGLVLGIAVALDTKGSPLYSQERVGRYGKPSESTSFAPW
jgi:hypothetical protein